MLKTGNTVSPADKAMKSKLNNNSLSSLMSQPQYYKGLDLNKYASGSKPSTPTFTSNNSNLVPKVAAAQPKPQSAKSQAVTSTATPKNTNPTLDQMYSQLGLLQGQLAQVKQQEKDQKAAQKESQKAMEKAAAEKKKQPTFSGVLQDLVKRASGSDKAVNQATADLTAFRQGTSQKIADIKSDPIPLEFQQGRAQVVQQASAEKEKALEQGVQNLIQARGQDLTALQQAASLAQPSVASFGQTVFDPLTGEYTGGGSNMDPTLVASQLAQDVVNNKKTYEQAIASLGYAGSAGQQFLDQAIRSINPGFNPTTASAGLGSAAELTGKASELKSIVGGAEANFDLLVDTARRGGVNDNNVPALNRLQQNVQRGLASQDAVVLFQSLIQTVRSQYAQVLGGGVTTVESLNEAKSLVPNDVSVGALIALGSQLKAEANNRIMSIENQIGSLTSGGGGYAGGGSGSIWDF